MNNPLFAGNPQLQEQFRSQLPIFLQQVNAHCFRVIERSGRNRRAATKLVPLADNDRPVVLSAFLSAEAQMIP